VTEPIVVVFAVGSRMFVTTRWPWLSNSNPNGKGWADGCETAGPALPSTPTTKVSIRPGAPGPMKPPAISVTTSTLPFRLKPIARGSAEWSGGAALASGRDEPMGVRPPDGETRSP
jgi:hypothetical protein